MPDGTYSWVQKLYSEIFPHLIPHTSDAEPTDGYVLTYNATTDKVYWSEGGGGGGGSMSSFTIAGDSGTNQTINDADTITIAGGTGLSSVASATDTITLNIDLTSSEFSQLENIDTTTISATQWGYLGGLDQSLATTDDVEFQEVTGTEFIGDFRGAVIFKAKAGEALTKGDVVYISSFDTVGNTPIVAKADADDVNKMPSFGLAQSTVSLNASVDVVTFGTLSGLDTSSFSLGDVLYVSTTAGGLTATAPSGESSYIQNIAKVTRSHASSGSVKVGGAGRFNAVSNLNDGNIFIGNASNQATTSTLDTSIVPENTNLYYTDARARSAISVTDSGGAGSLSYDSSTGVITYTGSTDVTLATVTNNYLSISGQEITAGTVPITLGGTGSTTASDARTALGVDAAGTDNSTDVTLNANLTDVFSISTQDISAVDFNANGTVVWDNTSNTLKYLGTADFRSHIGLATGSSVTFAGLTLNGNLDMNANSIVDIEQLDGTDGSGWLDFNMDTDNVYPQSTTDNQTVLGSVTHMNFVGDSNANGTGGIFYWGYGVNSSDSGTFTQTMSLDRSGNLEVSGDVQIDGDLTVSGTTTTINTETIELADNTIILNSNATGSASEDAGIEIERGSDANKTLIWDETNDRWTIGSETFVAGALTATTIGGITEANLLDKTDAETISGAYTFSANTKHNDDVYAYFGSDDDANIRWDNSNSRLDIRSDGDIQFIIDENNDSTNVFKIINGGSTNIFNLDESGNITNATWNGSVIASAYLDSDTAHLTTDQTFTGAKRFDGQVHIDTATNTVPLIISRLGSTTNENLKIGVDDYGAYFTHKQDETAASHFFEFNIESSTTAEMYYSFQTAGTESVRISNNGQITGYVDADTILTFGASTTNTYDKGIAFIEGSGTFGTTGNYGLKIYYEPSANVGYFQMGEDTTVNTFMEVARSTGVITFPLATTFSSDLDINASVDITGNVDIDGKFVSDKGTATTGTFAEFKVDTDRVMSISYPVDDGAFEFDNNNYYIFKTDGAERLKIADTYVSFDAQIRLDQDGSTSDNYISVGASDDLKLYHNSSSYIYNATGNLVFYNNPTTPIEMFLRTQFQIRDLDDSNETLFSLDTGARTLTIGATDGDDNISTDFYGNVDIRTKVSANLNIISTAGTGSPAQTTYIKMRSEHSGVRGQGIFYEDVGATNEQWYSGLPYAGSFNIWQVGFDRDTTSGDSSNYQSNGILKVIDDGTNRYVRTQGNYHEIRNDDDGASRTVTLAMYANQYDNTNNYNTRMNLGINTGTTYAYGFLQAPIGSNTGTTETIRFFNSRTEFQVNTLHLDDKPALFGSSSDSQIVWTSSSNTLDIKSDGDITFTLEDSNSTNGFRIKNSGNTTVFTADESGNLTLSGTVTAAGFTTTGTWTFDNNNSGTTGITEVQVGGTSFSDNDTSLMTAAAINDRIQFLVASEDTLAEMNDVTLTSSASGDLLLYNGSAWVNTTTLTGAYTFSDVLSISGTSKGTNYLKILGHNTTTDTFGYLQGEYSGDKIFLMNNLYHNGTTWEKNDYTKGGMLFEQNIESTDFNSQFRFFINNGTSANVGSDFHEIVRIDGNGLSLLRANSNNTISISATNNYQAKLDLVSGSTKYTLFMDADNDSGSLQFRAGGNDTNTIKMKQSGSLEIRNNTQDANQTVNLTLKANQYADNTTNFDTTMELGISTFSSNSYGYLSAPGDSRDYATEMVRFYDSHTEFKTEIRINSTLGNSDWLKVYKQTATAGISVAGDDNFKLQVSGGDALTVTGSDASIDLDTAKLTIAGDTGSSGQVLTTDGAGNISWSTVSSGSGTTTFTLTADSGSPDQTISDSDTMTIAGGTGISTVIGNTDTVTINIDLTSSEFSQLQNIGSSTISATQWGYVGGLNQALTTSSDVTLNTLTLSQATGTAPMTISSTTLVSNLNADLLDGNEASAFATSGHTHTAVAMNESFTDIGVSGLTAQTSLTVTTAPTDARVYVDGIKMRPNTNSTSWDYDFYRPSTSTIQFTADLPSGSVVAMEWIA